MNITTDASHVVRSRRSQRPDPATVWSPLAGLADAAANAATRSHAIAITRGFDRRSRHRAKALHELLDARGVPAIEITPAPGSERLLSGSEIAAVVNLVGMGSWQPHRLAAKLRAPLFVPEPEGESAGSDVIGMTGEDKVRDVALSRVAVRPEDASAASLTIIRDGEPLCVPGGQIVVTPHQQQLHIHLQGPDFAEQAFTAAKIGIETLDGPHRLIRDELPLAEFEGALTFTAEPAALVVRNV